MIEGLNATFEKYGSMIHKMHTFASSVIEMGKVERNYKTEEIMKEYRDDLPNPRNVFEEYSKWERRWKAVPKENQPDSVAKVLKVCDMVSHPNINVLLEILRRVAVTSCDCERSGIALKRLNTFKHQWVKTV